VKRGPRFEILDTDWFVGIGCGARKSTGSQIKSISTIPLHDCRKHGEISDFVTL